MLRNIILHGKLKELYADDIRLDVESVAEAIRGLSQIPKFVETLSEGAYKVCLGAPSNENSIPEEVLRFGLGSVSTIHIIPVMAGAKGGGGKIILGIALIAMAWYLSPALVCTAADPMGVGAMGGIGGMGAFGMTVSGTMAKIGLALVLGGISSMLSPQVKANTSGGSQNNFLFNGPSNTDAQGVAVPLAYGRCITGSVVVSSGLSTVNITPPAIDPVAPPSIG